MYCHFLLKVLAMVLTLPGFALILCQHALNENRLPHASLIEAMSKLGNVNRLRTGNLVVAVTF